MSINLNNIFEEAINHCRWKKVLHNVLKEINIVSYKNKTFDEIITDIYRICNPINGLGMLTIYDIASCICNFYNVNVNKVYIVGKGPIRAIKLLKLKTKMQIINDTIKIKYIDIKDVINAFDVNNVVIPQHIRTTTNGDILESFICNWQKTISDTNGEFSSYAK